MRNEKLSAEVKRILLEAGAAVIGIGDMSEVSNCPLPIGISVAVPIPVDIVRSLINIPPKEHCEIYDSLNDPLDEIVKRGEEFLVANGYKAIAQTKNMVKLDKERWVSEIPHKTVATRAGIGWIGKNCLLVTREFGSAVRIFSLLTDAPLECNSSMDVSECGECRLCVDICPG